MERTLKEKQGAVAKQYFSVADGGNVFGTLICCLEPGAGRCHTTCRSSQAHAPEMQGLHGSRQSSPGTQGWLEGQGSHFKLSQ